MKHFALAALFAAVYLAPAGVAQSLAAESPRNPKPTDPLNSAVGFNLPLLQSWGTDVLFVDVFKRTSPWIPQRVSTSEWDTGETLNLTPEGWIASLNPDQAAGTVTMSGGRHYPGGRYICLYEGEGALEFRWDARLVSSQPGRYEVDVFPNNGIYLKQIATNPANPMRNIRLIMPGHENTYLQRPFLPSALNVWRAFRVIRFMNWQRTTTTDLATWSARPLTTWMSQDNPRGVALEHMIDLCNAADANPWFCIPHLADDNFVTQFATMVQSRLKPTLKVYVEYSNEVWNGIFQAYWHAVVQGQLRGFSNDTDLAALRYCAFRSVEIFNIFRNVFTDDSRVVRILGSQHAAPWKGIEVMDWQNAFQNSDALAIAAYAGTSLGEPSQLSRVLQLTPAQIVAEAVMTIPSAMALVKTNADNARARGLRLVASEGGQHLVGLGGAQFNQQLTAKLTAANREPSMEGFYNTFMTEWRRNGGTEFVHFESTGAFTNWGSFGLFEYYGQSYATAPKFLGLVKFALTNPRWW